MLACPAYGATMPVRWRCRCGKPLTFANRPVPTGTLDLNREDLWAFAPVLPAALDRLRASGRIAADADVLVPLTGRNA